MYTLLGYAILALIIIANGFGVLQAVKNGKYGLAITVVFAVLFSTIVEVINNSNCICFTNTWFFRKLTTWFFEDILSQVGQFGMLVIFFLALIYWLLGERSIAPRIMINAIINLFLAFLWAKIVSQIISCVICPLICKDAIDWNAANQCVIINIKRWLGIGL